MEQEKAPTVPLEPEEGDQEEGEIVEDETPAGKKELVEVEKTQTLN